MKKLILISALLFTISGCESESPDEIHTRKLTDIKNIKHSVLNLEENIDINEVIKSSNEICYSYCNGTLAVNGAQYKAEEKITAKTELFYDLIGTLLDPSSKQETKKRVLEFFIGVGGYYDGVMELRTVVIRGKEYLDVLNVISPGLDKDFSYIDKDRNGVVTWSPLLDIQTKLLLYQELANYKGYFFDLQDRSFLATELCRAVDADEKEYTAVLIRASKGLFDPGMLRCVRDETYDDYENGRMIVDGRIIYPEKVEYLGEGNCPQSLRRMSGINYGRKVEASYKSWLKNVQSVNRDKLKSMEDVNKAFKGTFDDVPSIGSMNSFLDKYNKWSFGTCSETLNPLWANRSTNN